MPYECIVSEIKQNVALIRLHRPHAMNALNLALIAELNAALDAAEADDSVGAIVLAGGERAFAAGADIKEMQSKTFAEVYAGGHFDDWDRLSRCRKPVVAAVSGFALGGGCELAMMCDIVIAAQSARFGQPEINLGVLPGLGGTQRLTRAIGKAKAMDMCLTGRLMNADEAERAGLVSRIVPDTELESAALALAGEIAAKSRPAVLMTKEAVARAMEGSLEEGLRFERRLFNASFALEDQSEGMQAFIDKRAPRWNHR